MARQCGEVGDFEGAIAHCQHVLTAAPNHPEALHLMGLALLQQQRLTEAQEYLERAIALHPNNVEMLNHLGVVYSSQSDLARGIQVYRQAIALNPSTQSYQNLGVALYRQGNLTEAIATYQQLVERYPDCVEGWQWLGATFQGLRQLEQAAYCYRRMLVVQPSSLHAHNNLGTVLEEQGQFTQAIAHYREVLFHQPDFPNALINLGNLYLKQERFAEAAAAYLELLKQEPNQIRALDGVLRIKRQLCDWEGVEELSDRLMRLVRQRIAQGESTEMMPLNALLLPFTAAEQQAIAQDFAKDIERAMVPLRSQLGLPCPIPTEMPRRLRLGYVSGDFRDHAVAHLIRRLFALHDRTQFEVFAYSLGPDDGSEYRNGLEQECDRFIDLFHCTPTESAQRVAADGIHLLIDLAGYTTFGSPHLFALRPAPVQINYLGYPGTLGAAFMDYILTDPVLASPEVTPALTERCWQLPHCYQINDNRQPVPQLPTQLPRIEAGAIAPQPTLRTQYQLPPDGFVYCCFNSPRKIDPQWFALWMRILQQVPQSVLWLYESQAEGSQNLRRTAERQGIGGDRLIFARHLPKAEHLQRLACADLFLDTRYYNAHTTGSDALWAGVPLLTLTGETFASRVATSLLAAIGLPELAVPTAAAYESLAIQLAQDMAQLNHLKSRLAANRHTHPLFQTEQTVRALETAYRDIWQNACG